MKLCPKCNAQLNDEAQFCNVCGSRIELQQNNTQTAQGQSQYQQSQAQYNQAQYNQGQAQYNQAQYNQNQYQQFYNSFDHTREFEAKDISENKVLAMMVYLMGTVGIIVALLAGCKSPYLSFHVRESLKITVTNILLSIIALVLCWTFIVPFACGVMAIVFFVIKIICFFQICQGKAVEPAIIRSLKFFK